MLGFYRCVDPPIMYNGAVHQLLSNEVKGYITKHDDTEGNPYQTRKSPDSHPMAMEPSASGSLFWCLLQLPSRSYPLANGVLGDYAQATRKGIHL